MTNKNSNNNMDITREILTPRQFNKSMARMLTWGYLICAVVSFLLGSWMLSYTGGAYDPESLMGAPGLTQEWFPFAITFKSIYILPLLICVVCYVAMYFTASEKAQMVIFHISALNLAPIIAAVYTFFARFIALKEDVENAVVSGAHMGIFWLIVAAYVVLLYLVSEKWDTFFGKAQNAAALAVIYTVVMTVLSGVLTGLWIPAFVGILLFTLYVSMNWFHAYAYQETRGCNKYYAMTESSRIMNLFGTVFDMKGKTVPTFVQR